MLASENLIFSQDFCDKEAFHATLHPFIRNAVGSMEYGGTVLNRRMGKGNSHGNIRRTSDGFQLATAILFQNPVQNFALTPESYAEAPDDAIAFMKEVPTTWDETRYIDGYPGKYVVIARRHGDRWYVSGVNALDHPIDLKLNLPMLQKGQKVEIYTDTPVDSLKAKKLAVKNPGAVPVTIHPNHGFVIVSHAF